MSESTCEDYNAVTLARNVRLLDQRWKLILKLHKRLFVTHNSAKFVMRTIAERCFTREQRRYINRPTLIHAFEPYENVDTKLINSIYDAFDPLNHMGVDWRVMIFMLHVILTPTSSPCDHIIESYRFLTGKSIDLDSPCNTQFRLRNIDQIFQPLIRQDRMVALIDLFNDIWVNEVAMKDAVVTLQVTATNDPAMTFDMFSSVMGHMRVILEGNLRIDEARRGSMEETSRDVQYVAFEEYYYPISLLTFRRLTRIMKNMIKKLYTKAIEMGFVMWRDTTLRKRRISSSLSRIVARTHTNLVHDAFHTVQVTAVKIVGVSEVQRIWRGYRGRMESNRRIHEIMSTTSIQAFFRGILSRNKICTLIQRRKWASTEIQRLVRGYFKGRKIARKRHLTKIDEERSRDAKMAELRQLFITTRVARKIQRKFRANKAKKTYENEILKRRRELEVEYAMKQRQDRMEETQDIYDKRVEIHFQEQRSILEKDKARKKILDIQNKKAYQLRRRLANEQWLKETEEKARRASEYKQYLLQQRINDWTNKADERCRSFLLYCKGCLQNPETRDERQFRKKLRSEINKRVPFVLKRADANKIMMELDEARDIAEEQVIERTVAAERKKVMDEMEQDIRRLDEKLDKGAKAKEDKHRKRQEEKANWILCAAIRRWQARKELKKLCIETYEKIFDNRYKAFYYRNKKTGEVSWKQPLRSFDIPAVDTKWEEQLI